MRTLCLLLLIAGSTAHRLQAGNFSMALVDVAPNQVTTTSMIAVWSSTDLSVTAGTPVDVLLPSGFSVPSGLSPSACDCIFLRHTSNAAGAWAGNEVTFTAGTYLGNGHVRLNLPQALFPGKFYIRFDNSAGIANPAEPGMATLALVDPAGNTTLSRGFYIAPSTGGPPALGLISGTVKDSNGKALPGALVLASNYGQYLPVSVSARRSWVQPMGTTFNAYTAAAGGDGSYSLSLPPGNYTLQAEVWRHKNGLAQSSVSSPQSANVISGGALSRNFTLSPLP